MTGPGMTMAESMPDVPYIGRIPVRNIWLLLLYASDLYRHLGRERQGLEENPELLPDVVAELLCHEVAQRLQRRLSMGFQTRAARLDRVRGRLDLLQTVCHDLVRRGKVACRFEELSLDTARNRYVRAALESLTPQVRRRELIHSCRLLARTLAEMGVGLANPRALAATAMGMERVEIRDQPMMAAARLALEMALPAEESGASLLSRANREEAWVRHLFERAVGGFYEVVLGRDGWKVGRGTWLDWAKEEPTPGIHAYLPRMKTDIVLDRASTGRRIVIDTKFTTILARGHHREHSFKGQHLYQIYSYLRSQEGLDRPVENDAEGLLLYPSVGIHQSEAVTIQRHRIRFATVNLAGTAVDLRNDLLAAVSEPLQKVPL
jgi:5-methylcytosine-specific restriction enzyme subunit McrC